MYQAFLATSGDAIVVDSSKDISTLHLLAAMPDVRVRILHLVRDSRAVAYAWTKEKVRPNVVGQLTYMVRYSPRQSAADWMVRNLLTEAARGSTAGYMRVRYEDLIANPRRLIATRSAHSPDMPPPIFRIVVADKLTKALQRELERSRPDFLVRRPFHPAALRLLILHALYAGPERRASARVALSAAIRFRTSVFSRAATLVHYIVTAWLRLRSEARRRGCPRAPSWSW